MSSVQGAPGWLFDIGDEKLPNYMVIIIFAIIRIPINQSVMSTGFGSRCSSDRLQRFQVDAGDMRSRGLRDENEPF